ncbi:hypothetical protein ACFV6F_06185 [Kitasatospora phosalacinea]
MAEQPTPAERERAALGLHDVPAVGSDAIAPAPGRSPSPPPTARSPPRA